MARPSVRERDRAHFERVAAAKRAEADERLDEALARNPVARMIEGLVLGYAAPTDPERERLLDERALGQAELARLGRAKGRRVVSRG